MDTKDWFYAKAKADIHAGAELIERGTPLYVRRDVVQADLWIVLTRDGTHRVKITTMQAKTTLEAARNADRSVKLAYQPAVDRLHTRHLSRARRSA